MKLFRFSVWGDSEEIAGHSLRNIFQLVQLSIVIVAVLGIFIIEWVAPDFFNYPYFDIPFTLAHALKFWPLIVWGFTLSTIGMLLSRERSTPLDERLLWRESITYTLAGVWEELGFRFALIPYAMLFMLAFNWFWSTGLGFFLMLVFGALTVLVCYMRDVALLGRFALSIACAALAFAFFWWAELADPVFWIYDNILFPIANFMTAYMMSDILGSPEKFGYLFVVGAFAANSQFRDGHKYQGPVGFVNSWYGGMVLLYATLHYGIWVAIVVHTTYDLTFALTRYVGRKTFGKM